MFGSVVSSWHWFVDGLAEAILGAIERVRPRPVVRIELDSGGGDLRGADGAVFGRLVESGPGVARCEPASAARRIAGAQVELRLPPKWTFRRDLEPVASQSAPFLDAFVRHQIDRITPFRVADVFFHIVRKPLESDPSRLAVAVAVVPKRLVQGWIEAVRAARPARLRLSAGWAGSSGDVFIPLDTDDALRLDRWRRRVSVGLAALAMSFVGGYAILWWVTGDVRADIAEQDRLADERGTILARAQQRERAGRDAEARLRDLRASRPPAAETVEALAAALPDTAYLTAFALDKDRLSVSGVSTDLPALVPALENSHRFADVAYSAATTRVEAGMGDRFHLDMRLVAPAKTASAP